MREKNSLALLNRLPRNQPSLSVTRVDS